VTARLLSRLNRGLAATAMLIGAAACTHTTSTQPLDVLHGMAQCDPAVESATAQWLDDPQSLQSAYQRINRHRMGAPDTPTVDFETSGIVLIEMGQQTTGGYGLELLKPEMVIDGTVATIEVNWQTPAPGAIVTQALTSPCLMLVVPRGDYRTLLIVDQDGLTRFEIMLQP